ncbi:MAG TPA: hypothetical protein PKO15_18580 [Fibrobacteria bacterium]|nr:hypothetical protein [Fibrobacteria bacterium]
MIQRIALLGSLCAGMVFCAETNSTYDEVGADFRVTSTVPEMLISRTITFPATQKILIASDGRFFPNGGGGAIAGVFITVDGIQQTNLSLIDWSSISSSYAPKQHSYNCIGLITVPAGQHSISLMAVTLNGAPFFVGARSNLSIIVNPGKYSTAVSQNIEEGEFNFTTQGIKVGTPLRSTPILSLPITVPYTGGQIIALASSRIYSGNNGDPLTSIYINAVEPRNHEGNWSDNDMRAEGGAESQAPFFNHGYFQKAGGTHTLSYNVTELPYAEESPTTPGDENNVRYKVGAGSRLIGILGGRVTGRAYESNASYNRTNYIGIATSNNWPGFPAQGTDIVLARGNVFVPSDHNGIVYFTGKTRVQGDKDDPVPSPIFPHIGIDENVYLWLTIDGVAKGSLGVQDIGDKDSQSTRTLSTSFLATGADKLSFGNHVVELHAMALGGFSHLCMTQDLPLIWFD